MQKQGFKSIPVVILCGGKGTRMKEETEYRPKPLVEVGGRPILWHIMKAYAHHGHNKFILALGYKGGMIKEYFLNHRALANDFTFSLAKNSLEFHVGEKDDFQITFADTGMESLTGGRLLAVKKYIKGDEFMVTYGDGVSDIDINKLLAFHKKQRTVATITGVHPHSKYGMVKVDKKTNRVVHFDQKPRMEEYVSGGFIVFNKKIFDYLENGPMELAFPKLIKEKQLSIYCYNGFWKAVDTYQELEELNRIWNESRPWAIWENHKP
jgi:glucose-1-phosphate cytidylyltransferase